MYLSIVSPVYKGEGMIHTLVDRIIESVAPSKQDFEIILVNDASPDNSWAEVVECCQKDKRVKALNLSRNFGQHYAITAGLSLAAGEIIIVMDCDLQDNPAEIPSMINELNKGYDVVFAQRENRRHGFFKKLSSTLFYKALSYFTETPQDGSVANFGAYRASVIQAVLSMGDRARHLPTMVRWVGFQQSSVSIPHCDREVGTSSYNLARSIKLAADTIITFSNKPLRLMIQIGFAIVILSLAISLYYLTKYYIFNITVSGFTAIILSIWFSTGFLTILMGSIGIYVGNIFDQVKSRPSFIIKDRINFPTSK